MNIAYYMPFKPMGHPHPSGDLIIGTEIFTSLKEAGHSPFVASTLRLRWVYYRPVLLIRLLIERKRLLNILRNAPPDLWLSYHCYYKAPDLLGAYCAKRLNIPYILFQGIYSTKRRKKLRTYPGFILNRRVLESASHIFTNKKRDYHNLNRLIPKEKLTFIPPGIHPDEFSFSEFKRDTIRKSWNSKKKTVIITTAMMRPGVKTNGLLQVIMSCSDLLKKGHQIQLIIVGSGQHYRTIKEKAEQLLGPNTLLLGKVPREEMYQYYSAADIFAFPGVQESLGMVYLEAQSCELPAVAFEDWGGKEAIVHEKSGLLSPAATPALFTKNIEKLINNPQMRQRMGKYAGQHIRLNHDLKTNYRVLTEKLQKIANTSPQNNFSSTGRR